MKTGTKTCGAPARERMLGPEEEWSESCDITPTQEPSDQDQGHQGYREERNFRNVRNLSFLWNSLTSCLETLADPGSGVFHIIHVHITEFRFLEGIP